MLDFDFTLLDVIKLFFFYVFDGVEDITKTIFSYVFHGIEKRIPFLNNISHGVSKLIQVLEDFQNNSYVAMILNPETYNITKYSHSFASICLTAMSIGIAIISLLYQVENGRQKEKVKKAKTKKTPKHISKNISQLHELGITCCICMENVVDVLFSECGHACICNDCTTSMRFKENRTIDCPVCRRQKCTPINIIYAGRVETM